MTTEPQSLCADVDLSPDFAACDNCGADAETYCAWDEADGWCCSSCGAQDSDNEGGY